MQTNPAQITLSWPADPRATGYDVYRKLRDDVSWDTAVASLAGSATNYVDANVTVGGAYEYRLSKSTTTYSGKGYIMVGIQAPLVESRGKLIFLVDNTFIDVA